LDLHFIRKWRQKPWNWHYLSRNPSFSIKDKIETIKEFPWFFFSIQSMEEFVQIQKYTTRISVFDFCVHDKLIVTDVETYKDFQWDWVAISLNENITEDFVLKYKDKFLEQDQCLENLAQNPALSIDFLKKTIDEFHWDTAFIAANPNVNDVNFFLFFGEESFKCYETGNRLSENEGIPIWFMAIYPHFDWNIELINFRSDITEEHIKKYPNFPWFWEIISGCRSIDKNFLKNHPKTNMKEFYMRHAGLTIDEVEHLSPDLIRSNDLLGTDEDKLEYLRKYNAVRVIGNAFFNCYWFVDYAFCRKRLNKRYDELFGID